MTVQNNHGVRFVTVYLVDRLYGGPEEGGWWYNAGWVEECHVCPDLRTAEELAKRLGEECDEENSQRRSDIGSVLSEGRYEVIISQTPGENFPAETPRYE